VVPVALTVAVATALELREARRALPAGIRVVRVGVGGALESGPLGDGPVISCGLAGGVRAGVPTGTVVVATEIEHPDGSRRPCDPALTAALAAGARKLGLVPLEAPLATSTRLVTGAARAAYAARGIAAVDMETALLRAERIAAVRVVLDTPERELSEAWLSPLRALLTPSAWAQLPFLAREGPRCARLAAAVIAAAMVT
jgi:hypothetical protein